MDTYKFLLIISLLILSILGTIVGYIYQRSRKEFGPGNSIEETVNILVYDFKFGYRAAQKAVKHGDAILPILEQKTKNFAHLDRTNSFRFAWVLGKIQTKHSRSILNGLYSRTDDFARLVGAVGLAQHGAFSDLIDENSFLVKLLELKPQTTEALLAILALGLTRKQEVTPYLLKLLKRGQIGYAPHAYACDAITRIRPLDAIPVLRDCMKSKEFYALSPAFRTLITLGDREAIPLAIARMTCDLSKYERRRLVEDLKRVTGQSYGYRQSQWHRWWRSKKSRWQIPESIVKLWEEQNWISTKMSHFEAFMLTLFGLTSMLIFRDNRW